MDVIILVGLVFSIVMSIVDMTLSKEKIGWFCSSIGWATALVLQIHIIHNG